MENEEMHITSSGRKAMIVQNIMFHPVDCYQLTEKDSETARAELNETEELKKVCLQDLKKKLIQAEDVKYRTDDDFLLMFLRVKKFDCDKALKMIQNLYSIRKKNTQVFSMPPNLESLLNLDFCTFLPYVDEHGRPLYKVDFGKDMLQIGMNPMWLIPFANEFKKKWNTSEVSFYDILALMVIVSDVCTTNPRTQINGIMGIWDCKRLSASHLAHFLNPWRSWLFFNILQGCVPWRIKAIIGVNCGPVARLLYKALRPFAKSKIVERVILLGSDMSELHQHINPAVLPKSLGGQLEDSDCSSTQHVLNNLRYLEYDRSFGYKPEN